MSEKMTETSHKNQETVFRQMNETPETKKEKYKNEKKMIKVVYSFLKSSSNLFGVSKKLMI